MTFEMLAILPFLNCVAIFVAYFVLTIRGRKVRARINALEGRTGIKVSNSLWNLLSKKWMTTVPQAELEEASEIRAAIVRLKLPLLALLAFMAICLLVVPWVYVEWIRFRK